ncbi:MAG: DNA polymerase III subunit delta' [Clostridium sp.]|nr:DNA polymerase III subunit delta' [Clostridium sp.]
MLFSSIVGHREIRNILQNSIVQGDFPHAMLILGEDGIGKTYVAHEAALNILKKEEYKDYVDIEDYRIHKNKKSISVDDVRNIIEEVNKRPYEGDNKVIIVHDSDRMTIQAQNAFLKTIEEPPKGVYIILLCENGKNVLDTIKSRCQTYKLTRLNDSELDKFIKNRYPSVSEENLKVAEAFSDGVPGRLIDFMENSIYGEIRNNIIEMILESESRDLTALTKYEEFLVKNKDQWREILTCFLSYIRDIMVYKEVGSSGVIINLDKMKYITELSQKFSYRKLNSIIDIINYTKNNLQNNVNAAMVYHIMLLKIQEV